MNLQSTNFFLESYVARNLSIQSYAEKRKKKHPVMLHPLWAAKVHEFGLPVCCFLRRAKSQSHARRLLLPPPPALPPSADRFPDSQSQASTSDFTDSQARARRSISSKKKKKSETRERLLPQAPIGDIFTRAARDATRREYATTPPPAAAHHLLPVLPSRAPIQPRPRHQRGRRERGPTPGRSPPPQPRAPGPTSKGMILAFP
ncbi:hypothetical protein PAHAL_7G205100 [Panicum hallii]|uniref:Uncharacterized protein n=1 Tax=Panicum hallii TaxID=206008 RepID=A0A2T8ICZ1_9POAL|nr:hypothetical protein PAHAL_7G205100 [Panicum hallii]